jgi:deazaflavin-dependent oxidoreductase (nitroreductase family)
MRTKVNIMKQLARQEMLDTYAKTFKYLNIFMLWMWRLGLGPIINMAPGSIGQIMVLVHIGRKSGKKCHTPLNYTILDKQVYCMAGFGSQSQWYKNILANPRVEVWLPDGWWVGQAIEVTVSDNRAETLRSILIASGFAAPVLEGIYPTELNDEELEALLLKHDYRLLRIDRTAACTGTGGPGEYAWLWSLATVWLLLNLWRKKKTN